MILRFVYLCTFALTRLSGANLVTTLPVCQKARMCKLTKMFLFIYLVRNTILSDGNDFHFTYTECDKDSKRWRVAVPTPGKCSGGVPPFPVQGRSCTFECEHGTYLDIQSEQCKPCPAGTFNLGNGIQFDNFETIPSGFQVDNRPLFVGIPHSDAGTDRSDAYGSANCTESGWHANDGVLEFIASQCYSVLGFSANFVRKGTLSFTYFYPDDEVTFKLSIQNEQCMAFDKSSSEYSVRSQLKTTTSGRWRKEEVHVKPGRTTFTWTASSLASSGRPVWISRIEITGIGHATQCKPCPAGTYSSEGSKGCTSCQPGTYSQAGASKCDNCDPATQYSGRRAKICSKKLSCSNDDFREVYVPCNQTYRAQISYQWIQPKICSENLPRATVKTLPAAKSAGLCGLCNPGMERLSGGNCTFCGSNHYSDGGKCQPCPVKSYPNYGFYFARWNELPPNVQSACESFTSGEMSSCDRIKEGWQPFGDRIRTVHTRQYDVYLTLTLAVPKGFKDAMVSGEISEDNPFAQMSFDFEMNCLEDCTLLLLQQMTSNPDMMEELFLWNGTVKRRTFTYPILRKAPTKFMWAFLRGSDVKNQLSHAHDEAVIYSINVTNVRDDGGASSCLPCPRLEKQGCVPCPAGHFITEGAHTCEKCPANTYLNTTPVEMPVGNKSCVACEENMVSSDGISCQPRCSHIIVANKTYDFSSLAGSYQVHGMQIFGQEGSVYFHVFNLSICTDTEVKCYENLTYSITDAPIDAGNVSALMCRETLIPSVSENRKYFASPFSIADKLVKITSRDGMNGVDVSSNIFGNSSYGDVYFHYTSSTRQSSKCQNGRSAVVVFRCDPAKAQTTPEIRLPPQCQDGTCDGCVFHILVLSKQACPVCKERDYKEIAGPCVNGLQTIHSIPSSECVLSGKTEQKEKQVPCSMFPLPVKIGIATSVALASILITLTIVAWKKNKKLEYKYMKLVESTTGKDGTELPAAECCALDDDEEDEDRVTFSKGPKKLFGNLARKNGKREDSMQPLTAPEA